jgi:hypothetical protein
LQLGFSLWELPHGTLQDDEVSMEELQQSWRHAEALLLHRHGIARPHLSDIQVRAFISMTVTDTLECSVALYL